MSNVVFGAQFINNVDGINCFGIYHIILLEILISPNHFGFKSSSN